MKTLLAATAALALLGTLGGCAERKTAADFGGGPGGAAAAALNNYTPFGWAFKEIGDLQRRQARGGIDPTINPSTEECSAEDKDTECEEKNKMP